MTDAARPPPARTLTRIGSSSCPHVSGPPPSDGYSATFQMGMVSHVESGIDEAVVEDEPPTEALDALIRKVQGVFAGMT